MESRIRVLYAEDNAADAHLTTVHFQRSAPEFQLEIVRSGQHCLDRLTTEPPDILLLDYRLPDIDGIDLLKEVATRAVRVPIVMVTGAGDEELVVQVLRLGAHDYVAKAGDYLAKLPRLLRHVLAEYRETQEELRAGAHYNRVLYVEYHSSDIDLTLKYLAAHAPHLVVETARTASAALARLQADDIDIVLSDLRMPDMNALELMKEARHHAIVTPFIVLTGRGDEAMAAASLKLGAYDYIVKRDNYLIYLPYAIDKARTRFKLFSELKERQRLQQSNAETLQLLDTLQRHAPIGIAFLDREFRFRRVNEELAAINGLPAAAHLGRSVAEIVPGLWPQLAPLYERVLSGEPVLRAEIAGRIPQATGEERHWLASYYPVQRSDGHVAGIGVFVTEITERMRAEAIQREHTAALAEASRQKDEFLAMLSHELRNPLAPIRTALEVWHRSDDPEIVRHAQGVMDRQLTYMSRLLDDLLEVSRITSGRIRLNPQTVAVQQVITEAIDSTRPLVRARRHFLETSLPAEPLFVRGDPTRLVQVVVNLLNNAAKYTGEGGTIRIAASVEDRQVVLRVADTGAGISPRLLPKIFDLFTQDERTLDRAQGGLGLGLTLVRRITELHGGTVSAHSQGRGFGSEFRITLPLHQADDRDQSTDQSDRPTRSGQALRWLVVEDNVDAAEMLKVALEIAGHQVCLAFDGLDAVTAAAEFRPDAIVLDIGLPRQNGYEAARAIRQIAGLERVPIIALTGYGQDVDREKSRDAGIDCHLVKPIELDALADTVEAIRAGAARIDPPLDRNENAP